MVGGATSPPTPPEKKRVIMRKFVTSTIVGIGISAAALTGAAAASADGGGGCGCTNSNNATHSNNKTVRVSVKQTNTVGNHNTANTSGRNAVGGITQSNGSVNVQVWN